MAGRLSLPFDTLNDPEHPKTFRSAKHETLGKGHSLDRVGKKMVWLVYEALRDDLIKINTSFVKESLLNSRDKTAWLLEISNGPVKKVITEAKATGGFARSTQPGPPTRRAAAGTRRRRGSGARSCRTRPWRWTKKTWKKR